MTLDGQHPRTHPCPLCGLPARHTPRYPTAVCDDCTARAVDGSGRRVRGFNTDLSGGFVAHHVSPDGAVLDVCESVTASHRCWIDGRECRIDEARMGGVVVIPA